MSRPVNATNVRLAAELCQMAAFWIGDTASGNEADPFGEFAPQTHKHPTAVALAARALDTVSDVVGHGDYTAEVAAEAAAWILSGWRFPGDESAFVGADRGLCAQEREPRTVDTDVEPAIDDVLAETAIEPVLAIDSDADGATEPAESAEAPCEPQVWDFNPDDLFGDPELDRMLDEEAIAETSAELDGDAEG